MSKPMAASAKTFMTTLGLQSTQGMLPCFSKVRKAYRSLFKTHPDLGGDNANFQNVTMAARELFQYILDHPELVEKEPDDDTTQNPDDEENNNEILKMFENSTNIKYNEGSVTFQVDKDLAEEWKDTLEENLNVKATNPNQGKLLFTKEDWVIPGKEDDSEGTGSVIVSIWSSPAKGKGKAKLLVQGKMFFEFTTLILPTLATTVRKKVMLQITANDKEDNQEVPVKAKKERKKVVVKDKVEDKSVPEMAKKDAKKDVEENGVPVKFDKEQVKDKEGVEGVPDKKYEEPVKEKAAEKDTVPVAKEDIVSHEKEDVMNNKSEEVVDNDIKELENHERVPENVVDAIHRLQTALIAKCSQMDTKLTSSLEMQTEMKNQVINLTDEVKALKASAEISKDEMKSEIKEIKVTVDKFQSAWDSKVEHILETAKNVKERIDRMKEKIDKLKDKTVVQVTSKDVVEDTSEEDESFISIAKEAEGLESSSKELPGSTSKEVEVTKESDKVVKKVIQNKVDSSETTEIKGDEEVAEEIDIEAITERKVVFFHSSVAINLDVERFEKATKSKLEMVRTYHIEEDEKSRDPDLHLCKTVGEYNAHNCNLAVFAVGSNDVKKAEEDETLGMTEKIEIVKRQCEQLVDIATNVSVSNNLDSFIIEQIPRYESPGMMKLQKFANSYLNTLVTKSSARLHLVSQASLFRHPGEARKGIHCNDNHLTARGLYYYNTNLISEVHNVFSELAKIEIHSSKNTKPQSLTKNNNSKKEAPKQTFQQFKQNHPYRAPQFPTAPQQQKKAAAGAWAQGPPREQQYQGPPRNPQQYQGPPSEKQQQSPPKELQHPAQAAPREQKHPQGPPLPWVQYQGPPREQQFQQGPPQPWDQQKYQQGPPKEQQQYLAPPTKQQYQGPIVEQKPQPSPREQQQQQFPPNEWNYQQPLSRQQQQQPLQWKQQQGPQTYQPEQQYWQLQQQQGNQMEQQNMQGPSKVPQPYPPVSWGPTPPSPPSQHYTPATGPAVYWGPTPPSPPSQQYTSATGPAVYWGLTPSPSPPAPTNYSAPLPPNPVPVQGGQGGYNYYSG